MPQVTGHQIRYARRNTIASEKVRVAEPSERGGVIREAVDQDHEDNDEHRRRDDRDEAEHYAGDGHAAAVLASVPDLVDRHKAQHDRRDPGKDPYEELADTAAQGRDREP
jgi:hypothetical protein